MMDSEIARRGIWSSASGIAILLLGLGFVGLSVWLGQFRAPDIQFLGPLSGLVFGSLGIGLIVLGSLFLLREHREWLAWLPGIAVVVSISCSFSAIIVIGEVNNPFTTIYRSIQLFAGQGQWTQDILEEGADSWIAFLLHTARLVAVVATVSALLALFRGIHERLLVMLTGRRGHTVLCGLGEAGIEFVRQWHRSRMARQGLSERRLIIIEQDPENPHSEEVRNLGYGVVQGNAFDEALLERKAKVAKARNIVHMLPDDNRNIELAIKIRGLIEDQRRDKRSLQLGDGQKPTRLLIHVDDVQLARRTQDHNRLGPEAVTETRFFNFYESSARQLFGEHPPDRYANILGADCIHIAIYGFGKMGEAVLRQAVRLCHFANDAPLVVSIFDRQAGHGLEERFWESYPGLAEMASAYAGEARRPPKICFYDLPDARIGVGADVIKMASETQSGMVHPPIQHIVCFDSDEVGAAFGLSLRDTLRTMEPKDGCAWDAPVFIRLKRRHGLAKLFLGMRRRSGNWMESLETPDSLHAFGMLDDVIAPSQLLNEERDALAQVIHDDGYRRQRKRIEPVLNIWRKESAVPWAQLNLHFKSSNRSQADHVDVKLRSLRCVRAVPSVRSESQGKWHFLAATRMAVDGLWFTPDNENIISVHRQYTSAPIVSCWKGDDGHLSATYCPESDPLAASTDVGEAPTWINPRGSGPELDGAVLTGDDVRQGNSEGGVPVRVDGPLDPQRDLELGGNLAVSGGQAGGRGVTVRLAEGGYPMAEIPVPGGGNWKLEAHHDRWPYLGLLWKSDKPDRGQGSSLQLNVWDLSRCALRRETWLDSLWRTKAGRRAGPMKVVTHQISVTGSRDREWHIQDLAVGSGVGQMAILLGSRPSDHVPNASREQRLVVTGAQQASAAFSEIVIDDQDEVDSTTEVEGLAVDQDGQHVLALLSSSPADVSKDKVRMVRCWQVEQDSSAVQLNPARDFSLDGVGPATCLTGGKVLDKFCIILGTKSGTILLVDEGAPKLIGPHFYAPISAISISNDGTRVAAGCKDGEIAVFGLPLQGTEVRNPQSEPVFLADPWLRLLRSTRLPVSPIEAEEKTGHVEAWEKLARVEHDRWSAYHFLENWRYGEHRVDAARVHNNLTSWSHLGTGTRQFDSGHVGKLPLFLDRVQRGVSANPIKREQICHDVWVGVVGHRPHRLTGRMEVLSPNYRRRNQPDPGSQVALEGLANELRELVEPASGDLPIRVTLVTALAEGADRSLTEAIIRRLEVGLIVLLPLPFELYYKTFLEEPEERTQSVRDFTRMVASADMHAEMPMRFGNLYELGRGPGDLRKGEKMLPRDHQFRLLNAYLAQRCDYLVAAWDGKEMSSDSNDGLSSEELKTSIKGWLGGQGISEFEKPQPGGTAEAIKWWLDPYQYISREYLWHSDYRCQANTYSRLDRLILF